MDHSSNYYGKKEKLSTVGMKISNGIGVFFKILNKMVVRITTVDFSLDYMYSCLVNNVFK